MTYEEAQALAIQKGALKPQGFGEGLAASTNSALNYQNWSQTPRAQARLKAWTEAILNGADPDDLKRIVG